MDKGHLFEEGIVVLEGYFFFKPDLIKRNVKMVEDALKTLFESVSLN